MNKTLLVVGAGREQVPALERALENGLRVVATDLNPNAPGAKLVHAFHAVSTTDHAATIEVARKERADGVMTLSSETAVPTVAAVNQALGLRGFGARTATLATDKLEMKRAFAAHDVASTPFAEVRELADARAFVEERGLPAVIKPAVNSGQRGASRIDSRAQLERAVEGALAHAPDGRAIIEGFAAGPEVNVTAVVEAGRVEVLSLSRRVTAEPPHFGIAIAHHAPAQLSAVQEAALRRAVSRAVSAIELEDGIIYPQLIVAEEDVSLVEIAVRIPGGYMREVALHVSGVDLIDITIAQALGTPRPLASVPRYPSSPALVVRFLTALDEGRIRQRPDPARREQAKRLPGVKDVFWHLPDGAPIPPLDFSGARFAAVIATGASLDTAKRNAEAAVDLLLDDRVS